MSGASSASVETQHLGELADATPVLGPQSTEVDQPGPGGDWPYTKRVLPWLIAAFLVMLWLVPFDAAIVPISLPIDSKLDRFALGVLLVAWAVVTLGSRSLGPRRVHAPIAIAILVFLSLAILSAFLNFSVLSRLDEIDLAVKKIGLLFAMGLFFYIVATELRRSEMRPFITLLIVLASITAIGTIVEYRTDVNHFYDLADRLLPGIAINPEPPNDQFGRPSITGPTSHGLAVTVLLAMVLPFALIRLMEANSARDNLRRLLYAGAVALLLAGGVATIRKTALVAPVAAILVLIWYRPRPMLKLLPLGVVMVVVIQGIAPGALSGIRYELTGGSELSNQARTDDYGAIEPDLLAHPVIGRGYGTYDPLGHILTGSPQRHRFLDNQYLLLLIEVGIIGLLAYLAIIAVAIASLHTVARRAKPARAGPAVAIIGGIAAFAVANFLFDALAFPHVPYLFFFLLALGAICARGPEWWSARLTPLPQPAEPR
jgi:hypothetical protein